VTHDLLTGLANRNMLYELFQITVKQIARTHGTVALILLDIDQFKSVNDDLGQDVGDKLLIHVASKLTANLRRGDISARIGGDEFVVMFTNVPSTALLVSIVERLIKEVIVPVQIKDHVIHLSVNVGVSMYPHNGNDIQTLIKLAELALNQVKEEGTNRFKIYSANRYDELNQNPGDAAE
jgi:diguanylate cyclase (GGDEF)-like protein